MHSDNQFTNGIAAQKHSALFASLNDTKGTPAFGKRLAAAFLPDSPDLNYREGWAVGQNMQTPEALELDELLPNDVPYVGMLGWTNSYIAFNDRRLTGFEMLFGYVGSAAFAEPIQGAIHGLTDSPDPKGWNYQLDSEALINLYYVQKRKVWRRPHFDGAISFDAALGNFFTHGQTALEMRFGNIPDGFAYTPTPIGRGMTINTRSSSANERRIYGSIVVRATRFLLALPREGNNFGSDNLWTRNNSIQMEKRVRQVVAGLHIDRGSWAYHLSLWLSSDTIKRATLRDNPDPRNDFVVFTFERRIAANAKWLSLCTPLK
jgi:hypothetical protein